MLFKSLDSNWDTNIVVVERNHASETKENSRSQIRRKMSDRIWDPIRGESGWLSQSRICSWRVVATYHYLKALQEAEVLKVEGESKRILMAAELDRAKTAAQLVSCLAVAARKYQEPVSPRVSCCSTRIRAHLADAVKVKQSFPAMALLMSS